jgi:hypothetical protein
MQSNGGFFLGAFIVMSVAGLVQAKMFDQARGERDRLAVELDAAKAKLATRLELAPDTPDSGPAIMGINPQGDWHPIQVDAVGRVVCAPGGAVGMSGGIANEFEGVEGVAAPGRLSVRCAQSDGKLIPCP